MFNYSCHECGGNIETKQMPYEVNFRGIHFVVPDALIGVCVACGARYFNAKEYDRWEKLFEKSLQEKQKPLSASQIKQIRKRLGLNQRQFAVLIGCSHQSIYNWENPKRRKPVERQADLMLRLLAVPEAVEFLLNRAREIGIELPRKSIGEVSHDGDPSVTPHKQTMIRNLAVYCADIGSVPGNNFAWFAKRWNSEPQRNTSMEDLAKAVAADLQRGMAVALGFECPLFVPIAERPEQLTTGRKVDSNRSWSAGAGCTVLTTGLVQVLWILREVRRRLAGETHRIFLDWEPLILNGSGLFIWEAFVSGKAKRNGHAADAEAAVDAFVAATSHEGLPGLDTCTNDVYSLIGAALLRSGWSADPTILCKPCVVVRVTA